MNKKIKWSQCLPIRNQIYSVDVKVLTSNLKIFLATRKVTTGDIHGRYNQRDELLFKGDEEHLCRARKWIVVKTILQQLNNF